MSEDAAIIERPQENLFHESPVGVIRQAYAISQPLAKAIQGAKLTVEINGRDYVRVEGWTMLGSMLGVFPLVVSTRQTFSEGFSQTGEPVKTPNGWEAVVEARTLSGAVVGRAEAQCTRDERMWSNREDYALRAMAQTRATSRAMRGPLGFVVALAGFEATAAEEMPRDAD